MSSDFIKEIIVGGSDLLVKMKLTTPYLNGLDEYLSPALGIAWESGKLLLNLANSKNPLKQRFIEFIGFINKNKESIEQKLDDQNVISGLITLYEFTMKQRFEEKRLRAFGIFLGFINSDDKDNFELERMYNTLNLMNMKDIQFLAKYQKNIIKSDFEGVFGVLVNSLQFTIDCVTDVKITVPIDKIHNLSSLGMFLMDVPHWDSNRYILTDFGRDFIRWINN